MFGQIQEVILTLNEWGHLVEDEWQKTAELRPYVQLGSSIVMPNHMHGIIVIDHQHSAPPFSQDPVGAQRAAPSNNVHVPSQSLGAIIRSFKSAVTRRIRIEHNVTSPIWQRNYHEHIIRNEASYNQIMTYIEHNPATWQQDKFFTE